MIGRIFGNYKVTERIGAGGMGEIYRAEDMKLFREVAIKALPDAFAQDAERLARFEREARLLAALNHPNIASIYGLEQADGKPFLVMELVAGETLAEKLKKGRIPLDETLDICRQIAEGLEAAHEKGIVHRDLKPANVKVTPEGKVKILDFGLARALQDQTAAVDLSVSPTISSEMTRSGVILGTAAYMSPEQAKMKTVDRRADIWAFGCVLYECLTGERAFQGDTVAEAIASVLKTEPDWNLLPAETPRSVRAVIRQCLQKDPGRRLRDIADAFVGIEELSTDTMEPVPSSGRTRILWIAGSAAAGAALAVLVLFGLMKQFQTPQLLPVSRSIIRIEPGQWLAGRARQADFWRPSRTAVTISSDGRFIVYCAIEGSPSLQAVSRLYIRRTDQLEAKVIAGTEGAMSPFLSPDDRWIGFWADGELLKVPVDGGVPTVLCSVPWPYGFSWGSDNQIVYAQQEDTGLFRVPADGGKPEMLTAPDKSKEEYSHRLPHCLPGGSGILFTIMRHGWDVQPRVAALEPGTHKWRTLLEDASDARYVPTGHLAFLRQGTMMIAPFDPDRLEVTAQPVATVANVAQSLNTGNTGYDTGAGQFSISASGSMIYVPGGILPDRENSLVWVDARGETEPITNFRAPFFAPRLSPDGDHIAYSTLGKERQVWIYDLPRGTATRLTSEGMASWVAWTPDDRRLAFGWSMNGLANIYWEFADGSAPMERVTENEYDQYPASWSPDGQTLAFVQNHPDNRNDILFLGIRDRKVTPGLNSRFQETYPEFSPDGRWIAYTSNESGRDEVYVQAFPGPGGRVQISSEGGTEPVWSRSGRQIFYRQRDQVWATDIRIGSRLTVGKSRLLFEQAGFGWGFPVRSWDVSRDGRRFLMVKLDERRPQPLNEMILVQNWFEELVGLRPKTKTR